MLKLYDLFAKEHGYEKKTYTDRQGSNWHNTYYTKSRTSMPFKRKPKYRRVNPQSYREHGQKEFSMNNIYSKVTKKKCTTPNLRYLKEILKTKNPDQVRK